MNLTRCIPNRSGSATFKIRPADYEIATVVRRHVHDVAGVETAPHGKDTATDQRDFVNDAGLPAIIWGPGVSEQSHTVDEWAPVDTFVDSVEVLCRTTEELCTT